MHCLLSAQLNLCARAGLPSHVHLCSGRFLTAGRGVFHNPCFHRKSQSIYAYCCDHIPTVVEVCSSIRTGDRYITFFLQLFLLCTFLFGILSGTLTSECGPGDHCMNESVVPTGCPFFKKMVSSPRIELQAFSVVSTSHHKRFTLADQLWA